MHYDEGESQGSNDTPASIPHTLCSDTAPISHVYYLAYVILRGCSPAGN